MDSELFLYFKDISVEALIISFCIFCLTMLIKWPIKKATANLTENRRKAINTIIVFIPMILSLILNILYFYIFKGKIIQTQVYESMGSSYLLAVLEYAIYSKIILIIKGIKNENTVDFSKETISAIKGNIKNISSSLKLDETKLNNIVSEIEKLLKLKDELNKDVSETNNKTTEVLDINIESLMSKKLVLEDSIAKSKTTLLAYEETLNK